jgi:MerR family transcriptional regulator, redox-sensitive transcriptional activator SoxR
MKIGELSRRTGLSSSAIRYYEQERLIPRPARLSGRRVFDDRSLAQIVVVQLARDAGFTLAEIRQLVTEFGESRWRRLAERKLLEIQATAERLRTMTVLLEKLLRCECPDVEFCGRVIQRHNRGGTNGRGAKRLKGKRLRPPAEE